jgi:5-methylcytosine-specific restriction endonuclease McrA
MYPKPSKRKVDKSVYEKVMERDGTCLWGMIHHDGCSGRLHMHHIKFRGRGGDDTMGNLITLCARHHQQAHDHLIAPEELTECLEEWMEYDL